MPAKKLGYPHYPDDVYHLKDGTVDLIIEFLTENPDQLVDVLNNQHARELILDWNGSGWFSTDGERTLVFALLSNLNALSTDFIDQRLATDKNANNNNTCGYILPMLKLLCRLRAFNQHQSQNVSHVYFRQQVDQCVAHVDDRLEYLSAQRITILRDFIEANFCPGFRFFELFPMYRDLYKWLIDHPVQFTDETRQEMWSEFKQVLFRVVSRGFAWNLPTNGARGLSATPSLNLDYDHFAFLLPVFKCTEPFNVYEKIQLEVLYSLYKIPTVKQRLLDEKILVLPFQKTHKCDMICLHAHSNGPIDYWTAKIMHERRVCQCYCECSNCWHSVCTRHDDLIN